MDWYAVYTKPKQEDRVEKNLLNASLEVFNPKIRKKKYVRNRYEYVVKPFFPCYVFVRLEPGRHYHMVSYTRGVRNIVGAPWPVSEEVINIIRSRMNEEGFVVISPDIKKGDRVEITETPLKGFVGIFDGQVKDSDRVMVLLSTIEYQAKVEIEKEFLDKL